MLKKTITYTDYNGQERVEVFHFNLNSVELTEMELSNDGGYSEKLKEIVDANDGPGIIKVFKELILKSYGEKSEDGKRFIKSEKLSEAFSQTEAYSELFMELATDADAGTAFVNGIIPANLESKIK